jgi:Flp pilus assembly pilin Flp
MLIKLYKQKKTQTAVEYAALIIIIAGALIVFSVYLKRASQGRIKEAADTYGGQMQYEKP